VSASVSRLFYYSISNTNVSNMPGPTNKWISTSRSLSTCTTRLVILLLFLRPHLISSLIASLLCYGPSSVTFFPNYTVAFTRGVGERKRYHRVRVHTAWEGGRVEWKSSWHSLR